MKLFHFFWSIINLIASVSLSVLLRLHPNYDTTKYYIAGLILGASVVQCMHTAVDLIFDCPN